MRLRLIYDAIIVIMVRKYKYFLEYAMFRQEKKTGVHSFIGMHPVNKISYGMYASLWMSIRIALFSQWVECAIATIDIVTPSNGLRQRLVGILGSRGEAQEIVVGTEVHVELVLA